MPTSRQSTGTTSAFQYSPGQASSQQQGDQFLSSNPALVTGAGSALSAAILGTTIAGSTVNAIEVWADCTVWDSTNNRALIPGLHFDVSLLHRSGMGC